MNKIILFILALGIITKSFTQNGPETLKEAFAHPLEADMISLRGYDEIPDSLREIKNLRTLVITESSIEELPDFMKEMRDLKTIHFYYCDKIPRNLHLAPSLMWIDLVGFRKASVEIEPNENVSMLRLASSSVPDGLENFKGLKTLMLLEMADSEVAKICKLSNLDSLTRIQIGQCASLHIPPCLFSDFHLRKLEISYVSSIEIDLCDFKQEQELLVEIEACRVENSCIDFGEHSYGRMKLILNGYDWGEE